MIRVSWHWRWAVGKWSGPHFTSPLCEASGGSSTQRVGCPWGQTANAEISRWKCLKFGELVSSGRRKIEKIGTAPKAFTSTHPSRLPIKCDKFQRIGTNKVRLEIWHGWYPYVYRFITTIDFIQIERNFKPRIPQVGSLWRNECYAGGPVIKFNWRMRSLISWWFLKKRYF